MTQIEMQTLEQSWVQNRVSHIIQDSLGNKATDEIWIQTYNQVRWRTDLVRNTALDHIWSQVK